MNVVHIPKMLKRFLFVSMKYLLWRTPAETTVLARNDLVPLSMFSIKQL